MVSSFEQYLTLKYSLPRAGVIFLKENKAKRDGPGKPSKIEKIDLSKVEFMASQGHTDAQLAEIFGVTEQTVNNWKTKYPQFFESLKAGKLLADSKVEASLYQRACGYSHPDVHIVSTKNGVETIPIIKHYPPDPTSMIFWLKNRKPAEWRDKVEHTGEGGGPLVLKVISYAEAKK